MKRNRLLIAAAFVATVSLLPCLLTIGDPDDNTAPAQARLTDLSKANRLRAEGDLAGAVAAYQLVADAYPEDEHAWIGIGMCLLAEKNVDAARLALTSAPEDILNRPSVLRLRARISEAAMEFGSAYRYLSSLRDLTPDDEGVIAERACVAVVTGNWDSAEADFKLAFSAPFRDRLWLEHCVIWRWALYQLQGRRDSARELIEMEFRDLGDTFDVYRALGLRICGRLDENALFKKSRESADEAIFVPDVLVQSILGILEMTVGSKERGRFLLRGVGRLHGQSPLEQGLAQIALRTLEAK